MHVHGGALVAPGVVVVASCRVPEPQRAWGAQMCLGLGVSAMVSTPGFASLLAWDEGCPGGHVLQPVAVVVGAAVVAAAAVVGATLLLPHWWSEGRLVWGEPWVVLVCVESRDGNLSFFLGDVGCYVSSGISPPELQVGFFVWGPSRVRLLISRATFVVLQAVSWLQGLHLPFWGGFLSPGNSVVPGSHRRVRVLCSFLGVPTLYPLVPI